MKLCLCLLAAGAALVSSAAETGKYVDPNPYGSYGPAMARVPGRPMAIEWHLTDRASIDKATAPEALEAILEDENAVASLLAEVKPGYGTDALAAAKIAAVSQYVMERAGTPWWKFWRDDRSLERRLWAKALLNAAGKAADDYVAEYYLDQLRWCALSCQIPCIRALAEKSNSKAVKEMAAIVIDQLAGCGD
jgi:hypothetical protein